MSHRETHHLDVDFEVARSIHRVVRAMHDGECPSCHVIVRADEMRPTPRYPGLPYGAVPAVAGISKYGLDLTCPKCGFAITAKEQAEALRTFAPVMERNLAVFEEWRAALPAPAPEDQG